MENLCQFCYSCQRFWANNFYSILLIIPLLIIGKMTTGYCVKCRTKREMKDAKPITMKNGRPATRGICPTCGTKMFRIGKG